jgi:hypothetical protein
MNQIDDPSSSDINNNEEIEIDKVVSGPQKIQESRLDTNETAGSLWRYFFHILLRDVESVMKKTARLTGMKSFDCFLHLMQLV